MNGSDLTDKRKHIRYNCDIVASFINPEGDSFEISTGVLKDISLGGVFLSTNKTFSVGTEVQLNFSLGDESVQTVATVKWFSGFWDIFHPSVESGMGLSFLNFDSVFLNAFASFLKKSPSSSS